MYEFWSPPIDLEVTLEVVDQLKGLQTKASTLNLQLKKHCFHLQQH